MSFQTKELEVFIGKGIRLPLNLVNGTIPVESGTALLQSSIRLILAWELGTRFFLNEYGSRLTGMLEEQVDDSTLDVMASIAEEAIETWEKRVELQEVTISRDKQRFEKINVKVVYRVKGTNLQDTAIYPFYSQISA